MVFMAVQSTLSSVDDFLGRHVPKELLFYHLGRLLQPREGREVLCLRVPYGDDCQESPVVTSVYRLLAGIVKPSAQCRLHHPPSRLLDRIRTGHKLSNQLVIADVRGWGKRNMNNLLKYVDTAMGGMHVVLLASPYPMTGITEGKVRLIPIDLTQGLDAIKTPGVLPELTSEDEATLVSTCIHHYMAGSDVLRGATEYLTKQRQLLGFA